MPNSAVPRNLNGTTGVSLLSMPSLWLFLPFIFCFHRIFLNTLLRMILSHIGHLPCSIQHWGSFFSPKNTSLAMKMRRQIVEVTPEIRYIPQKLSMDHMPGLLLIIPVRILDLILKSKQLESSNLVVFLLVSVLVPFLSFLHFAIKGASKAVAHRLFTANSTSQPKAGAPSKNASKKGLRKKYKLDQRRGKEDENPEKANKDGENEEESDDEDEEMVELDLAAHGPNWLVGRSGRTTKTKKNLSFLSCFIFFSN